MKIVYLTTVVSPHTLPVAKRLHDSFGEDFLYLATGELNSQRAALGWGTNEDRSWIVKRKVSQPYGDFIRHYSVFDCDILIINFRDIDIINARGKRGKTTYYSFERWFKPLGLRFGRRRIRVSGWLRLLHPKFMLMAWRFARAFAMGYFVALPTGVHAAADWAKMIKIMRGRLLWLIKRAQVKSKRIPGATINGCDNLRLYGYFVDGPMNKVERCNVSEAVVKVLWVGRIVEWKRVDEIVKAIARVNESRLNISVSLDIYGFGPDEWHIRRIARGNEKIRFYPPVSIGDVRKVMAEHDVYVLSSDAGEGWGVVLNEAMLEGMAVIGTYEAGSSATIIDNGYNGLLYHSGDIKGLADCISKLCAPDVRLSLGRRGQATLNDLWSPDSAVKVFAAAH